MKNLRSVSLLLCIVVLCLQVHAGNGRARTPVANVPGDRWMEIDLYWFDRDHVKASVDEFWNRFASLFQGVKGDRGIILNIGWTVGYVMEWSGDPAQRITLPAGTGEQPWVSETTPLEGDTATRMREWKERFAKPIMVEKHGYGAWTYEDLAHLAALMRVAGQAHGVAQFKVGSLVYAWDNAYGEVAPWVTRHPESFSHTAPHLPGHVYVSASRYFDPGNTLHADTARYAAYPNGYPEGTAVHEAFAKQWGSLSKTVGLDALMLRDSFGMMVPYSRRGRLGELMPSPEMIHKQTDDAAALVRETKQANPKALLMMYSNAMTAIGDWRANGCDLERIANEGFLDVFVDQTWAGAWNEVGTRHNHFWNEPQMGWTYQLQYTLLHGAMLAKSRVKHYPLIETFDAWESWDTLHTVPQRLRWSIWAYSHAGVKTPQGLRMPEGSYISWANQGKRLLSEDDVHWLATNIGEAVKDAADTTDVFGPTLVYSRSSNQWEAEHATPTSTNKPWIDEQAGSITKWPVPIQSVTRVEWLPRISTDLAIVQTPIHLADAEEAGLMSRIRSGKPVAMFGSFANGIDGAFLSLAGITGSRSTEWEFSAHTAENTSTISPYNTLPKEFPTQTALDLTTPAPSELIAAGSVVLYSVDNSAQLLFAAKAKNLLLWDPADFRMSINKSLKQIWGEGVVAYSMTAAALNEQLHSSGALHAAAIDTAQTGTAAAWRTRDGRLHILSGNTEEGLRDDADRSRHITLVTPRAWPHHWQNAWGAQQINAANGEIKVDLPADSSVLLEAK